MFSEGCDDNTYSKDNFDYRRPSLETKSAMVDVLIDNRYSRDLHIIIKYNKV